MSQKDEHIPDDYEAFYRHEHMFCDECGEHLFKHDNGCPGTKNEFMLEVKRQLQAKRRVE